MPFRERRVIQAGQGRIIGDLLKPLCGSLELVRLGVTCPQNMGNGQACTNDLHGGLKAVFGK